MTIVIGLLFGTSIVAFVGLLAYGGHHQLPTWRSARERLIARNPWLNRADLSWTTGDVDASSLANRARTRLAALTVTLALSLGVAVDRRPAVDTPRWYDR